MRIRKKEVFKKKVSYSTVGILALIVLLIVNRQELFVPIDRSRKKDEVSRVNRRYRYFLIACICYFVTDIAWGFLYEHHDIPSLFPIVYSFTIFYFIFMFLTMLTWIRYVVAYLDKSGLKSKALLYYVWSMFTLAILYLMVNRFHPFIFYFNDAHEYVPESGRYIAFLIQILLYAVTSTYLLYISARSKGQERIRYMAVGLTCLVIGLFQVYQIANPLYPYYAMGLLIASCVIHSFVVAGERKEKEIYDNIARSFAEDFEAMYYITIETGEYHEFSKSEEYDSMKVPVIGKDFYAETRDNAARYAHPDDRVFAISLYTKETMLDNLEGRRSFSYKYRIMVGEQPRYYRFTVMRANDDKHLVLYVKDIEDEITAESMRLKNQKKQITFSRIAESLASNYDVLYYVNVVNSKYVTYESNNIFGQLEIKASGDDFYEETMKNIPKVVHEKDRELVADFIDRDHMITAMSSKKRYCLDYRLIVDGKTEYFRMTVRKTSDGTHFIIGVDNIDEEVKKEKQQLKALKTEKELARRDELTGTRNKTAYTELARSVQNEIDNDTMPGPFAIVVCDANNLKQINDTKGHVAGDEYIKASAGLLCDIFVHSPVFRVGGDELAVFLRDGDHAAREELMKKLRDQVLDNQKTGQGPILASGMSEFDPESDRSVSEVFDRADKMMYENKQELKAILS